MDLPVTLHKKIIEFLTALPQIHDGKTQQALVYSAGLDHQLQRQIVFGGSSLQFVQEFIVTLSRYGTLKDGRNALEAVIETAKSHVGQDKRTHCEVLLQELRVVIQEFSVKFANQDDIPILTKKDLRLSVIANEHETISTVDSRGLLRSEFIDREDPLHTLTELFSHVKKSEGQFVLISGEEGIGKTQLWNKFKRTMDEQNIPTFYTYCRECGMAYEPLQDIIIQLIGAIEDNDHDLIAQAIGKFGWDLVKVAPKLAQYPFMKNIEKLPELRDSKAAEFRLFNTMINFMNNVAVSPFVICFDDLQWADEQVYKWLAHAIRNITRKPILLIGLYREEGSIRNSFKRFLSSVGRDISARISLNPLCTEHVSKMIAAMLNGVIAPQVSEVFFEKTQGNPLFIDRLARDLWEKQGFQKEENVWKLTSHTLNWPDTIKSLVIERLQRALAEETADVSSFQKTLQVCATLGRKFEFRILQGILSDLDEEVLIHHLEFAQEKGFLIDLKDGRYEFRHDSDWEAIRDEMTTARYQMYCRKAGETFERLYADDKESVINELARYFYSAHIQEKAVEYCEIAGDLANKNYANKAAISHYNHAIAMLQGKDDTALKVDLLLKKARILRRIGRQHECERIRREALLLSEKIHDKRRMAHANRVLARSLYMREEHPSAMLHCEKALKIYEEIEDQYGIAAVTRDMGLIYDEQGASDIAMEHWEKSLKIGRELDDKPIIAAAMNRIGGAYADKGEYKKAIEHVTGAMELWDSVGDHQRLGEVFWAMGYVYKRKGDIEKAVEWFDQAMKIGREVGYEGLWSESLAEKVALVTSLNNRNHEEKEEAIT